MSTLLDTPEERHAFAVGFFEVLCPWPPRYDYRCDRASPFEGEEHYYHAGRGIGFVALLCLICLAAAGLMYLSSALG